MQTCLDDTGHMIVRELYKAVSSLSDDPGLLSCIGSWGDTMDDAEVLQMLKGEPFVAGRISPRLNERSGVAPLLGRAGRTRAYDAAAGRAFSSREARPEIKRLGDPAL